MTSGDVSVPDEVLSIKAAVAGSIGGASATGRLYSSEKKICSGFVPRAVKAILAAAATAAGGAGPFATELTSCGFPRPDFKSHCCHIKRTNPSTCSLDHVSGSLGIPSVIAIAAEEKRAEIVRYQDIISIGRSNWLIRTCNIKSSKDPETAAAIGNNASHDVSLSRISSGTIIHVQNM